MVGVTSFVPRPPEKLCQIQFSSLFFETSVVDSCLKKSHAALTRKRVRDGPETWSVHYGGVRVGVIVERSGAPPSSDPWQ